MPELNQPIAHAAEILRGARLAVALTGAGLSTESGIPDFRSPGGLWSGRHSGSLPGSRSDGRTDAKPGAVLDGNASVDPMEVASLVTFRYDPQRFFTWVRPLAVLLRQAQPNAAHRALADLEALGLLHGLITQNIDRLHSRAGSRSVLELHGSLETATCIRCYAVWDGQPGLNEFVESGRLPTCLGCGGLLKPNITLMGEQLQVGVLRAAHQAARQCDVLLVAGSSLEVMPAAGLPAEALNQGAALIVINLQPTYIDARATVRICGNVADVLPRLVKAARASVDA